MHLLEADHFLRSINLCYDADDSKRIAHFHPTTKSVTLLRALLGYENERSFFVVAPYGSGKSINITYALHLIENRAASQEELKIIEKRMYLVSPEILSIIKKRRQKKSHGLVIAIHGHNSNLPQTLKEATLAAMKRHRLGRQSRSIQEMTCNNIQEAILLLRKTREKCISAGFDRINILWDEFGRHLEALTNYGHSADLADIQLVAEYASRSSKIPIIFTLTLHQNLLYYAGQMVQSARSEWIKISGRFKTLQYIDDSKEIYRLISEVVEANRGEISLPTKKKSRGFAKLFKQELGLFTDFSLEELSELFIKAYPLDPMAIYLLPRVSARVAQNERTMFTFLYATPTENLVNVASLFDYFSESMRADTAVGGTYKQWLETQSALNKIDGDNKLVEAIKTICLLSLGISGERASANRQMVTAALQGYGQKEDWAKVLRVLVKKKLLIYRKHNDEVSIWHGTDANLRQRLEEEKERHRQSFRLIPFLFSEASPVSWKPIQYNTQYGICRYWTGEYIASHDFSKCLSGHFDVNIPIGCDGKIYYLIAEDNQQLEEALKIAKKILVDKQAIVAIPKEPVEIFEAALEVWCLNQMQSNADLTASDPLVLPEIQQMSDDSRSHLQRLIDLLTIPNPNGPKWFYGGKKLHVSSTSKFRKQLSEITKQVFDKTPIIHNEMIVRKKPSSTIINSRKKLLRSILECHGEKNLRIQGRFPDYSMFRTILLHTGLYEKIEPKNCWDYVSSDRVEHNKGLASVWQKIEKFFSEPQEKPKEPKVLFDELKSPPHGLRDGILPILFAAGLKAFAHVVSLKCKGEYVTDILPTVIEDLCKNPASYQLIVLGLDKAKLSYLRKLHQCFSPVTSHPVPENDLIRMCYDAINSWRFQLPSAALTTRNISLGARQFQRLLASQWDPIQLLLTEIPEVCGIEIKKSNQLLKKVFDFKEEFEEVAHTYVDQASSSIRNIIADSDNKSRKNIRRLVRKWANQFPQNTTTDSMPAIARGLLTRMRMEYENDDLLIDSLSLLVVGKPISRWDDSTSVDFNNKFHDLVHRIEEIAISADYSNEHDDEILAGLSSIICERITELHGRLRLLVGDEKAAKILESKVLKYVNKG